MFKHSLYPVFGFIIWLLLLSVVPVQQPGGTVPGVLVRKALSVLPHSHQIRSCFVQDLLVSHVQTTFENTGLLSLSLHCNFPLFPPFVVFDLPGLPKTLMAYE